MNEQLIKKLNLRATKNLRFEEIIYNEGKYFQALDYLKNQKLLKYNDINKILKPSSSKNFPIGNILIHNNKIVGFMGTFYSLKNIKKNEFLMCNIHSWIVDEKFRLNSFFLLSPLLEKKINFTAFTPVKSLVGLLKKLGFKSDFYYYKTLFNLKFLNFSAKKFTISFDHNVIKEKITQSENDIVKKFSDLIYVKFVIYNDSFSILIIGSKMKKKKLNVFNIFYVSDVTEFKSNWDNIKYDISKLVKTRIFSEFILNSNESYFPDNQLFVKLSKKEFFINSDVSIDREDLLSTDLIG